MANFQAYNDKVWTLPPMKCFNPNTGQQQPWPAGVTLALTSGLPNSLGVTINSNVAPVLTPKVINSPSIPVTVSGNGVTPFTFFVDVVPDPNQPLQVVVDTAQADATSVPQATPTNPGP